MIFISPKFSKDDYFRNEIEEYLNRMKRVIFLNGSLPYVISDETIYFWQGSITTFVLFGISTRILEASYKECVRHDPCQVEDRQLVHTQAMRVAYVGVVRGSPTAQVEMFLWFTLSIPISIIVYYNLNIRIHIYNLILMDRDRNNMRDVIFTRLLLENG